MKDNCKSNINSKISVKIKNKSSKEYFYLQAEFSLFDEDGQLIGTAFGEANDLKAGGDCKLEARVFEKVTAFDLEDVSTIIH